MPMSCMTRSKIPAIVETENGEAYDRYFQPVRNEKLSEHGVMAEKTMNTLLHVMEAYTELYRVDQATRVEARLKHILDQFANHVYNPQKRRQEVFFDQNWNSLMDLHSYGHDIESSWLIDRCIDVLKDKEYEKKLLPITKDLAEEIYKKAYKDHSLMNECDDGAEDKRPGSGGFRQSGGGVFKCMGKRARKITGF